KKKMGSPNFGKINAAAAMLLLSLHLLLSSPTAAIDDEDAIISRFQAYLKINTSHPNPNYHDAAEFLIEQGKSIGLVNESREFVEGKPVVILKWHGSEPNLSSILLNSHVDVVPVEADKWDPEYPPFAANISEEGNIYARGTQDVKSVGMQYLEAVRLLKASQFQPRRTIYLTFVPDEEIGGKEGAALFVNSSYFAEMNVGIGLDEGMANPREWYRPFYAERSPWWLVINATGEPGHGSGLYDNSAAENLQKSLEAVWRFRASQFNMIKSGNKTDGEVVSVNLAFLKAGTPTPTGFVMNTQPSVAEAGFDIRVPPTADPESLDRRIREEYGLLLPEICHLRYPYMYYLLEITTGIRAYIPVQDISDNITTSPWWVLLEKAVTRAGEKLGRPEIFQASTDAHYFRAKGVPVISFSPIANTTILAHNHKEYLNKDVYLRGIDAYVKIIEAYASYAEHSSY
ncbi:hypothetical protein Tsubulata_007844, partial [Turnera subulata]